MPCIRTCKGDKGDKLTQNPGEEMSKKWEKWDLRILALYILVSQLYLHFFGRRRTKSKSAAIMIGSISLLYLLSDLLATTALGKLSKLAVNMKYPTNENDPNIKRTINILKNTLGSATIGKEMLRVMWGPLILFYLGGPDTITVLNLQENQMWMKHLIGLFTQGFRAVYALIATWSFSQEKPWSIQGLISLLALFILIPGIIKYGERVWVVMSNSNDDYTGLVPLGSTSKIDEPRAPQPRAKLALLAHSWLHTLRPHAEDYECDAGEVRASVTQFREKITTADEAFRLIAIELRLIYEMLFSKVGTIFTLWGSILRFLSFSFLISVLVVFLIRRDKLPEHFDGDDVITIVLLAGAIFLDLAGIVVQLSSNWALVWACNNIDRIIWGATPVLFLHKNLIYDRPWWSGVIGQLSLRKFCKKYKSTWFDKMWGNLFGKEKMLKRYRSKKEPVLPDLKDLKDLIFDRLCEMSETRAVSGVRRADQWTLLRDDLAQQFKYWSNELEFSRSIVIWHIATEVCYLSDHDKDDTKACLVKMLSDYMMYLLVAYPSRFPFCNICEEIMQNQKPMKKLFNSCKGVKNKGNTTDTTLVSREEIENKGNTTLVDKAQRLVQSMKENHENSWDIMGKVWVEMMRYAARESPVKEHIEELRRGGEFLTHVWLLLLHLGDSEKLERRHSSLVDEDDSTLEDSKDNDWDITRFWW